jgi:GT2 family glycosyltransferase
VECIAAANDSPGDVEGMSGTLTAVFTVAIPYYSGIAYLRAAVESVLRQTCTQWRLLLLDDSGDEGACEELTRSFGDPRITYIRNTVRLGLAGNFNAGLDRADTDLVSILHADDELAPEYIADMLALAQRHAGAALLFCDALTIDAQGNVIPSLRERWKRFIRPRGAEIVLEGERAFELLARGNFIMCPTVCFRRSAIGALRFSPEQGMVVDLDFWTRAILAGKQMVGIDKKDYRYRRHTGSHTVLLSGQLERYRHEEAIYRAMAAQARARGWRRAERIARRANVIKLSLAFDVATDLAAGRVGDSLRKAVFLKALCLAPRDDRDRL